jgi:dihydrodipicolinate synthase/N-acetylneuraminate lyase
VRIRIQIITSGKKLAAAAMPLLSAIISLTIGSIPAVLKEALNKIGIEAGPSRLPILPVSPQVELQIQQMVDNFINEGILVVTTVSSRGE